MGNVFEEWQEGEAFGKPIKSTQASERGFKLKRRFDVFGYNSKLTPYLEPDFDRKKVFKGVII